MYNFKKKNGIVLGTRLPISITLLFLVTICSAQNVGIGTTTPSAKLHVNGSLRITNGTQGAGKVLTSDANGNATWQQSNAANGTVGFGTWGDCSSNNISEYQPEIHDSVVTNDVFGTSLAMDSLFAFVGAPGAYFLQAPSPVKGAVYVYRFNGTHWVFFQKLTDPTGEALDKFGTTVALSGQTLVVGAPGDDVNGKIDQGSACIFRYNGSSWVFAQKIFDATGNNYDEFGKSLGISGNHLIVGVPRADVLSVENIGIASFYRFNGSSWVFTNHVFDGTSKADDYFASSVAISGNIAVVGCQRFKVGTNSFQGKVSTYLFNGTQWVLQQSLIGLSGEAGDRFGCSVSIEGNSLLIGAEATNVGGVDRGSAFYYELIGNQWTYRQQLSSSTEKDNEYFGSVVSISGNYAMVGSGDYLRKTPAATIIYNKFRNWTTVQMVPDPAYQQWDGFGNTLSIHGGSKRFVIGSLYYFNSTGKISFGKIN
jgi:hypothetical protein